MIKGERASVTGGSFSIRENVACRETIIIWKMLLYSYQE